MAPHPQKSDRRTHIVYGTALVIISLVLTGVILVLGGVSLPNFAPAQLEQSLTSPN